MLNAIFVGGTFTNSLGKTHAVVARINLSDNLYEFRKLYTEPSNNNLEVVTALAVDPAGTKLAVHASDKTQSSEDLYYPEKRVYTGSAYSYLFTVSVNDGSQSSKLMRLAHGLPVNLFAYQVWSSGFRLRDDGKLFIAFNMHLDDWGPIYEAKQRIGCYDTVSG